MVKEKTNTVTGKWEELRAKINFTAEEEKEMKREMAVIQKIIDKRKKQKMSQAELSKRSGVRQPVIARIERGINSPQLNTLIKLLNALNCQIKI